MQSSTPSVPVEKYPGELNEKLDNEPLSALAWIARQCGDIAHFNIEGHDIYQVNKPEYVYKILVSEAAKFNKVFLSPAVNAVHRGSLIRLDGKYHHQQKRMLQPLFYSKKLNTYSDVIVRYANELGDKWEDGRTIDLWSDMTGVTVRVLCKAFIDVGSESAPAEREVFEQLTRGLMHLREEFDESAEDAIQSLPQYKKFTQANELVDLLARSKIAEKRAKPEDNGDMLSWLVTNVGDQMTDEQLRDHMVGVFFAGYDTTATAMTWTWYLLSRNPQVESKFHAEIDAVLSGRLPTAEDIARLPYLNSVLTESMRVNPPVWILKRRVMEDVKMGDYTIPKGSVVFFSQYLLHHDPRYFPDPEKFVPERWTSEFKRSLPKTAYFPFGGGLQICLGEPLA